jgi:hypothetical protein
MAVAFFDDRLSIELPGQRSRLQLAPVRSQAHRASQIVDTEEVAKLVDDVVGGIRRALGRVRVGKAAHVASVLDRRPLEAITDTKVGDVPFARDLGGAHHAACTSIAEATGHQNSVRTIE